MSYSVKPLHSASHIYKHIDRFPDLKCDGVSVWCIVCNLKLVSTDVSNWKGHLKCAKHRRNKKNGFRYSTFLYDFIFMCCACNIPLYILEKEHFRVFWKMYVPNWDLPTRRTASRELNHIKRLIMDMLTDILKNKNLSLTVDQMTDAKGHHVVNVLARILEPDEPTSPYLLASKRFQMVSSEIVQELVVQTLETLAVSSSQVLMVVTGAEPCMIKAGQLLKNVYPNLIHVSCVSHILHLVEEEIRRNYLEVGVLVENTRQIFAKHIKTFHLLYPDITLPPHANPTWLAAVDYYHHFFQQVKSFILQLDPNELKAIPRAQKHFNDPEVEDAIHVIYNNYSILSDAIQCLENSSLSLRESLRHVCDVRRELQSLKDEAGLRVSERCNNILSTSPGYENLCFIDRCLDEKHFVNGLEYFKFANVTLVDAKRSFSFYSDAFTQQRRQISGENMEAMLLMQMFAQAQPQLLPSVCDLRGR